MVQEKKLNEDLVRDLIGSLNNIPHINRGWCLFAAYGTYLKAKELGIKKVSIVQIDWSNGYFTNTNKAFLKWEVSSPVSGNHFVIKVGSKMFDSRWEFSSNNYADLIFKNDNEIQKLCVISLKWSDWNDDFDRWYGVKQIKKILWIDLSYCL